eukprot:161892-Chlamydomonas_euryale.AAC.1
MASQTTPKPHASSANHKPRTPHIRTAHTPHAWIPHPTPHTCASPIAHGGRRPHVAAVATGI